MQAEYAQLCWYPTPHLIKWDCSCDWISWLAAEAGMSTSVHKASNSSVLAWTPSLAWCLASKMTGQKLKILLEFYFIDHKANLDSTSWCKWWHACTEMGRIFSYTATRLSITESWYKNREGSCYFGLSYFVQFSNNFSLEVWHETRRKQNITKIEFLNN